MVGGKRSVRVEIQFCIWRCCCFKFRKWVTVAPSKQVDDVTSGGVRHSLTVCYPTVIIVILLFLAVNRRSIATRQHLYIVQTLNWIFNGSQLLRSFLGNVAGSCDSTTFSVTLVYRAPITPVSHSSPSFYTNFYPVTFTVFLPNLLLLFVCFCCHIGGVVY